ncbi:ATP-binding protein [Methylobacterium brachythecii]|uniref:histidine kinase n=1 Tax=Methylobacterium brachythecii TaxID=1176177 RepID=A0ABQ6D5N8_9HYPH|nr:ATP-binding protein [Methylobacterium brachythecii]GLS43915.1 two-component sensor histidine kinase [Methylobacterium brachythecii]
MSTGTTIAAPVASKTARPAGLRRFWPRPKSVAGQIALLGGAAIVASHAAAAVALFAMREPWRAETRPGVAANRLAVIARLLDETAPEGRDAIIAAAGRSLPNLRLEAWQGTPPAIESERLRERPIIGRLLDGYGRELALADLAPDASPEEPPVLHIGLRTPAGAQLQATLPDDALEPPKRGAIIFSFLFLATTLTLLTVWATRALTAPLAQLAGAAEAFGTSRVPLPLPRRGPDEVLALAAALDRMRARVNRLIDDRTQMLAAISHDLRTPITRLRLRAEFIEDDQARERTLRDLDQMNALVEAALAYARDERGAEGGSTAEKPLIDIASLVQTVCDDYSDTGANVSMEQARHVLIRAHPEDLERAVNNLVDNAVKYAGSARLSVSKCTNGVAIEVADDGPGIPESERHAMLQPFVRGDRARNLNDASGFGLGLSIVLAIVEAHDGRLTLENRPAGGLSARIELPGTLAATGGQNARQPEAA